MFIPLVGYWEASMLSASLMAFCRDKGAQSFELLRGVETRSYVCTGTRQRPRGKILWDKDNEVVDPADLNFLRVPSNKEILV